MDFSKRKSRLIPKIENYFKTIRNEDLLFGEILDKYCEIGMSRISVQEKLIELTNRSILINESTLWYALKETIAKGLTNFKIKAKFQGNPLSKYVGRKNEKTNLTYSKFHCFVCDHIYEEKFVIKNPKVIGLRTFYCPNCKKKGTLKIEFKWQGIVHRKTLLETIIPNCPIETFIDENGEPLEVE